MQGDVTDGTVRITNLLDEVVAEPQRNTEGQINISALPPGHYLLPCTSDFDKKTTPLIEKEQVISFN